MCLFFIILLFGPRLGLLVWWLLDTLRFDQAFDGFLLPLLGFLFLPWTTLMYVVVFRGGVNGFDWVWLMLGFLADVASYASSGYGNRHRFTDSGSTQPVPAPEVPATPTE